MLTTNFDRELVSPDRDSKYSLNLYRYLRRAKSDLQFVKAFRQVESGELWLGFLFDGDFIGNRMMRILCDSRTAAYSFSMRDVGTLDEVPEFWTAYLRDGRCAIDPEHRMGFIGDTQRWTIQGSRRRCNWCGNAEQQRVTWTETKVIEHESWVPVAVIE